MSEDEEKVAWTIAPLPANEAERINKLNSFAVLDTEPELCFDDITQIAAEICEVPMALVSLVDTDRQWFKSRVGLDATETPRSVAFCAHTILDTTPMEVSDALDDPRFRDNPLVTGAPHIRFYMGVPLDCDGLNIGTLCLLDQEPRRLTDRQIRAMACLARQVVAQLNLRSALQNSQQTNRALIDSNQQLEQFANIASHDLRAPLRAVTSFTNLLQDSLANSVDEDVQQYMQYVVQGAERMDALLRDLVDYSRVDSRAKPFAPVNMRELIDDVLFDLGPNIRDADAQVNVDTIYDVFGDVVQLRQVFQNLISNAIKFCQAPQPQVDIDAAPVEKQGAKMVRFSIRDNGIGIDSKHTERIFEIFQRLHRDSDYPGTGLGLALTKKIVEKHGGKIYFESQVGEGTTFHITLPTQASS